MNKLMGEIEDTVVKSVLNKNNATYFYLEAIKVNLKKLYEIIKYSITQKSWQKLVRI